MSIGNVLIFLCLILFYCYGAKIDPKWTKEDPRLAQKTMELKQQALKLMELRGHKIGKTKVKKETVWGDIQMNWRLYKNLKAQMDKEQKDLEKTQTRRGKAKQKHQMTSSRLTAPDFNLIPYSKWTETDMPIKYTLFNVYTYEMKSEIRRALREIETTVGCLSFQEVGSYPYGPFIDYVEQRGLSYCGRSPLGKDSRINRIILDSQCSHFGTALHETLHSLGFAHTQQRPDVDQYLWINWDNIQPWSKPNFIQWGYALKNQGRFDYGSIMMYPRNAAAIDYNRDTMTPRYNEAVNGPLMGQRNGLSSEDIRIMRVIYCSGNTGNRRNNGGGSTNRGVTSRPSPPIRPSGRGNRVEGLNTRKVSNRRCYGTRTEVIPCQGVRKCDYTGTYEASCNQGFYFQINRGQYICTNYRGNC